MKNLFRRKWALVVLGLLLTSGTATAVVTYRGVIFFGDGSSASVSATNTGAIRYNNTSHAFEQSTNGGGWSSIGGTANPNTLPVLTFTGADNTEANCGHYWPTATNLGAAYYEYIYRPDSGCDNGYVIADGLGGAHALLMGCKQGGNPTGPHGELTTVTGNIADNSLTSWSFGSDDGCWVGQWCEPAVYYDNNGTIYVFINGVLSGKSAGPSANTRQSPTSGNGMFLVGGSTHSNGTFAITALRGVESFAMFTQPWRAYHPDSVFTANYWDGSTTYAPPSIWLNFTTPGLVIPDLSNGYNSNRHACALTGATTAVNVGAPNDSVQTYPRPMFAYDANAPVGLSAAPSPQCYGPTTPASAPPGAKIFDSFTRSGCDSTFVFDNAPSLGSTESGSLGVKTWTTGLVGTGSAPSWGYLNGRAVQLTGQGDGTGIAYVNGNSGDMEVRVDRFPGSWNSGYTGLAFRVQDNNNFLFCYTDTGGTGNANPNVRCGAAVAGTLTVLTGQPDYTNTATTAPWTTLSVTTSGTTITIAVCTDDTCGTKTGILTLTGQTQFQTATGAGLFMTSYSTVNTPSDARFDNFGVY